MASSPSPARRLIVITNDLPYPPNHGHKVDQFNRWKGFAQQGWRLRLVCSRSPHDPPVSDADVAALRDIFETIDMIEIGHDLRSFARRLLLLPRYPSHVASRIPGRAVTARLVREARAFAPAAVVNDGIYGAALGRTLAQACGVPTIVRGHNVEHVYFAQQARTATGLKSKLAWSIARIGLKRWEHQVMREAAWSFQISADDIAFWRGEGLEHLSWAPTAYAGPAQGTLIPAAERAYDVAYIGNMRLPNNIHGLRWFIRDVLPPLRALRPGLRLCFAGANPSDEARALFADAPEIEPIFNAPSADAILANGRVLVNPILSGSGVNVKSIDMLRYDAPIVTTPIGVQGFPADLHDQFVICADAEDFARSIAARIDDPVPPPGRAAARARFGAQGLAEQIDAYARVAGV